MLVIAFDGILFNTLEFRATVVVDALAAEGIQTTQQVVLSVLPSRSLAEAVRAVVNDTLVDETTLDLVTLRAERAIAELGSRGATLNVSVCDRLRRAAAVTRIVIRADSRRRAVDELLALADLESVVSFTRCSDDLGTEKSTYDSRGHDHVLITSPIPSREPARASIERSYAHIARRMYGNKTLLGSATDIGIALEFAEAGRAVARTYGFGTPENFGAAEFPA